VGRSRQDLRPRRPVARFEDGELGSGMPLVRAEVFMGPIAGETIARGIMRPKERADGRAI
jgi:hypothetical protein